MPGPRQKFTEKQDRQVEHIKDSERARGLPEEEAAHRAYGHVQNLIHAPHAHDPRKR